MRTTRKTRKDMSDTVSYFVSVPIRGGTFFFDLLKTKACENNSFENQRFICTRACDRAGCEEVEGKQGALRRPTGRVGEPLGRSNAAAASSLVSCQAEADGDLSPWARSAGYRGGNLEGRPMRQVGQKALRLD